MLKLTRRRIARIREWCIPRPQATLRAARFWGKQHAEPCQDWAFWLNDDEIMSWVNLKVSGKPEIWPLSWFLLSLASDQVPVGYALSIGCGAGNLEREVIRLGAAVRVTGIDISSRSLEIARELADETGYENQITYCESDAGDWLAQEESEESIDLVFFHHSLHHIRELEDVLSLCADKLRSGRPGLLYLDEYIGPSRNEWDPSHLSEAASLFSRIPSEFRQWTSLQPPVAYDDPTEMIRSSEIVEVFRQQFELTEYKPYYGNVLMPLICGIRAKGLGDPRVREILKEAMKIEDELERQNLVNPLHAVLVGRPRAKL